MIETNILQVAIRFIKRESKRYLKPTAIHVEALHDDVVWTKVREYVRDKRTVLFVITPVNYDYVKIEFGIDITRSQYAKILKQRYNELMSMGANVQLHVHIKRLPNGLPIDEKCRMLTEASRWLENNVYDPTEVAFGWWSWDTRLEKLAEALGLRVVQYSDYYHFHDIDLAHVPRIR